MEELLERGVHPCQFLLTAWLRLSLFSEEGLKAMPATGFELTQPHNLTGQNNIYKTAPSISFPARHLHFTRPIPPIC
jgi:hypothetical protein